MDSAVSKGQVLIMRSDTARERDSSPCLATALQLGVAVLVRLVRRTYFVSYGDDPAIWAAASTELTCARTQGRALSRSQDVLGGGPGRPLPGGLRPGTPHLIADRPHWLGLNLSRRLEARVHLLVLAQYRARSATASWVPHAAATLKHAGGAAAAADGTRLPG